VSPTIEIITTKNPGISARIKKGQPTTQYQYQYQYQYQAKDPYKRWHHEKKRGDKKLAKEKQIVSSHLKHIQKRRKKSKGQA
jgi:hypothetical protein